MDIPALEFKDFVIKRAASRKEIGELVRLIGKLNGKNAVIQIFDSKRIANRVHLAGAYANALITFKNHTNRTRSVAMEMLLFAAMTDQIGDAIDMVGAKSSSDFVLFADKKAAFAKVKPVLKIKSEFEASPAHTKSVAAAFGIKGSKTELINAKILQKMALSRLNSN
jgi:tRNA threonylcarbamoyladenosine modification (KEOPS) complex Cgi121 subunit